MAAILPVVIVVVVVTALIAYASRHQAKAHEPSRHQARAPESGYIKASFGRYTAMWGSPLWPTGSCGHSHANRDAAMKCLERKRRTGSWA
jgi:hypothetical protein